MDNTSGVRFARNSNRLFPSFLLILMLFRISEVMRANKMFFFFGGLKNMGSASI
jgi:hypothetical protein